MRIAERLVGSARRVPVLAAAQWTAVALASGLGWRGYQEADRARTGINEAVVYFALAIVLVAFFTWDGKRPNIPSWPARIIRYIRDHPVELSVLALICILGAFVRLWQFGTLPPNGFLSYEEHIYAGVQWDILHGDRPYQYPTGNYLGAFSQWLLGPDTTGMRAHLVAAGILTAPLFYLMMREVVERPAALFATALFASLRVLADTGASHQTYFIVEIAIAWMLLRALNTGIIMWLVPGTVLAGLLSYEYETAKALPIFIAPFLAWVALRALLWPIPRSLGTIGSRIRTLGPSAFKGALAIAVIMVISFGPIIAESHRTRNIYFSSLDRQRGDREARGTPGLFAPNWREQLERSVQVYTPSMKATYPVIGNMPTRGAIDNVTSALIWAAVVWGVLFFWRGYRSLFTGWFLGGMVISSLLLSTWAPWKVIGWLPPAIVLVGFLTDDIICFVDRPRRVLRVALASVLVVVIGAVLVLNLRVQRANARDDNVMKEYANTPSQLYTVCRHLRERSDASFALVAQRARTSWGFSEPPEGGFPDPTVQWSDWRFICNGLEGQTTAGLAEFWPYYPADERPYTLLQIAGVAEAERVVRTLAEVMPELGAPATREKSPGAVFETIVWDATLDQLTTRQGLVLRWFDTGGNLVGEEIARGPTFNIAAPPEATSYELRGILLSAAMDDARLVATGPGAASLLQIRVDGHALLQALAPSSEEDRVDLLQGWHLVELRGAAVGAGDLALHWQDTTGIATSLGARDMFALGSSSLWQHTRAYPPQLGVAANIRYDTEPHVAAFDGLRIGPERNLPQGVVVAADTYRTLWDVPRDGTYHFTIATFRQYTALFIDGEPVEGSTADPFVAEVQLTAGRHTLEITFLPKEQTSWVGGVLTVTNPATSEEIPLEVTPFR